MNNGPSLKRLSTSAINADVFGSPVVARYWARRARDLFPAEAAVLERLASELRGQPLLDVGVGGGRTTPHLLKISDNYLGVDYSAEMVATCQESFPQATFRQHDARQLETLGEDKFDFALFSYNGIDYVGHEDRRTVLGQVYKVLRPGGYFLFSSHNLQTPREKPWELSQYDWNWRPRAVARNLFYLGKNLLNFARLAATQTRGASHGVFVDSAHSYSLLVYYVDPIEQVKQLQREGFDFISCLDHRGRWLPVESDALNETPHVHYLARRPEKS